MKKIFLIFLFFFIYTINIFSKNFIAYESKPGTYLTENLARWDKYVKCDVGIELTSKYVKIGDTRYDILDASGGYRVYAHHRTLILCCTEDDMVSVFIKLIEYDDGKMSFIVRKNQSAIVYRAYEKRERLE